MAKKKITAKTKLKSVEYTEDGIALKFKSLRFDTATGDELENQIGQDVIVTIEPVQENLPGI